MINSIPSAAASVALRVRMVESTSSHIEQRQRWCRQLQSLWGQLLVLLPEQGVCHDTYQMFRSCCELEFRLMGDCAVCHELEGVFEDYMCTHLSETEPPPCPP